MALPRTAERPISQVPAQSSVQKEHMPEQGVSFWLRVLVSLNADSLLRTNDMETPLFILSEMRILYIVKISQKNQSVNLQDK